MIQDRLRLIGLALIVFVVVPYLVLRQQDQGEQNRQSRQGKTVVTHFLGIPPYAQKLEDQISIAVFRRFLDKPENRDVIIDKFSGLEIKDLPASWDAMIQMAFAADRAPDIVELVTENIQTHRDEQFIRPLPDRFTFTYSNSAYDDLAGFKSDTADTAAGPTTAVSRFRAEQRRQEAVFQAAVNQARDKNLPDEQWLPKVAFAYDWALMQAAGQIAPEAADPANPPHLVELLDTWNDLMRRSGQGQYVVPAFAPGGPLSR